MNTPYVLNIQRFSVHDGPGIRTTIFFKGCPLRCPWCHNPESQQFEPETLLSAHGAPELVGKQYSVDELVAEAEKDIMFYDQSGGGVTLSGGEAMAQDQEFIIELVRRLKSKGFNIGIDTCGVAATENFVRIAKYVDFFLYDLKFINSKQHKEWTGASNRLVLKNLEALTELKATIYLRMILLDGINTDSNIIEETMLWLKTHQIELAGVNLLPYHRLGGDKFRRLGRQTQEFVTPSDETLSQIKHEILRYYKSVTIGG